MQISNADNASRFADPIESVNVFDKGVAKFSVPSGHYWAVGMFAQTEGTRYVGERIVVLPQFTVRASTSVSMAERAASSRIHMVIPRPSQVDDTLFTLLIFGASGPVVPFGWEGLQSQRVWVSPTSRKPTVGALQVVTASQFDSPGGAAGTPYEYGLAYLDTSGLVPTQRHVVHTVTLAHVHARYYQAASARVQQFMTVGTKQTDRCSASAGSASSSARPAGSTSTCRPDVLPSGPISTSSRTPTSLGAAARPIRGRPSPPARTPPRTGAVSPSMPRRMST